MRPVNLIPPEDRRGDRAPLRTGPLPYVLVGALAAAVLAVVAVVLVSNQVAEREATIAGLEIEEANASERAESLRAFADFASLSTARAATVSSLAQSRFDWERVLRELALVIPDDVWLTELVATASADTGMVAEAGRELRDDIAGPALSMAGCGESHEAVAGFLQALKDIDGVTRVGVSKSSLLGADEEDAAGAGGDDCRTRDFIASFEVVAAFDAVAVPAVDGALPAPEEATAPPAGTTPTGGTAPEVADAGAQQQQARDSAREQTGEAREATNVIPGVAR